MTFYRTYRTLFRGGVVFTSEKGTVTLSRAVDEAIGKPQVITIGKATT